MRCSQGRKRNPNWSKRLMAAIWELLFSFSFLPGLDLSSGAASVFLRLCCSFSDDDYQIESTARRPAKLTTEPSGFYFDFFASSYWFLFQPWSHSGPTRQNAVRRSSLNSAGLTLTSKIVSFSWRSTPSATRFHPFRRIGLQSVMFCAKAYFLSCH